VQLFHSAASAASRQAVAERIRSGLPYIVLGTRSALFLPHRNLGLVIVDEEHDNSYKQDAPAPRYHGRDAAILLAVEQGAQVLLGSATPSLESLYNAENGRFIKVDLKERFYSGSSAEILVIDTVAERRKRGMTGSFSRKLLAQLSRTLEEGGQALILRARRSYAPAVQCTECGQIVRCPHCNIPLSLHKDPDRLVCHYCGHTIPYRAECPACGGPLQPLGAGTQKVEEELRSLFPAARIDRLDGDTPPTEAAAVIKRFSKKESDILVGTQMITKGFDFEGLQLVAVLQADSLMGQQDFRADEHAVQLLEQFRGRSGRREKPGLFVIQTRCPGHPVFSQLEQPSAENLLAERRLFGYPPYTRIVRIIVKDSNLQRLEALSRTLREALPAGLNLTGPYAPSQECIGGEHIRHFRVMLPRDKSLPAHKAALYAAVLSFEKSRRYAGHIVLDVDPV
jgi:primosomal protein N' (replication factor Y)